MPTATPTKPEVIEVDLVEHQRIKIMLPNGDVVTVSPQVESGRLNLYLRGHSYLVKQVFNASSTPDAKDAGPGTNVILTPEV